jgi:hypothetical protein
LRGCSTPCSRAGARVWFGSASCPISSSRTRCRRRPSAARADARARACPTCPASTWPGTGWTRRPARRREPGQRPRRRPHHPRGRDARHLRGLSVTA